MELHNFSLAGVTVDKGHVTVDTLYSTRGDRHYNVTVQKSGDEYLVTGERPDIEFFMEKCYDLAQIARIREEDISYTKPFLFFKGGTPYLHGCCETKEREKRTYRTTNITVITD